VTRLREVCIPRRPIVLALLAIAFIAVYTPHVPGAAHAATTPIDGSREYAYGEHEAASGATSDVPGPVGPATELVPRNQTDIQALIVDTSLRWGLDPTRMLRVAWCESRWDPAARAPSGAAGLFQFTPRTWAWASAGIGESGASPFDARANVEAAAWLMANEGPSHWQCR
jgi:hypothetical protein